LKLEKLIVIRLLWRIKMINSAFLGLVQNAALLAALVLVFDTLGLRIPPRQFSIRQIPVGLIVGALGISIMATPWVLVPGAIFDTRSVLLGISGLFFGTIPTIIAIVITGIYRVYLGGSGALTGVLVIIATGTLGICWRHFRKSELSKIKWGELYFFGIVIHLVMLALMFTFPWEIAKKVFMTISTPVMAIYPLAAVLIGMLMVNKLRRDKNNIDLLQITNRLNETQSFAKVGGWEWNVSEQAMYWTDEVYRIHGFPSELISSGSPDLINKSDSCFDPEDQKTIQTAFQNCVNNGKAYDIEVPFTKVSGERIWIRTKAAAILEGGKIVRVIGNIVDITERKQLEEDLRNNEEQFRVVFEKSAAGYTLTNINGQYIKVNEAFSKILGYSIDELTSKYWMDFTYPDDIEKNQNILSTLFSEKKKLLEFEKRYVHKNGCIISALISITLMKDKQNNPCYYIANIIDITERKQAEEKIKSDQLELTRLLSESDLLRLSLVSLLEDQKSTEEQIRQLNNDLEDKVAERTKQLEYANKELEAFSYSVSHDLRAPVRAMEGYSSLLASEYSQGMNEEGRNFVKRIQEASEKMDQLISDLYDLSRVGRTTLNRQMLDIVPIASQIIEDLEFHHPNRKVKLEVPNNLVIEADSRFIQIVLKNLISNSYKFTEKSEDAKIILGSTIIENETVFFIKDNGIGFDMKHAEKLFFPFQRLHGSNEYPGSGIGLTIVQRIIHRHGGRIWPEAVENQGATFYFTLG